MASDEVAAQVAGQAAATATRRRARGRLAAAWPWLVTVAAVAAVLSPLVTGRDSFPLSDYPMFAGRRPPVVELAHVVGIRADGRVEPLSPRALGTREVVGAAEIARAAARDTGRAARLCAFVADRVRGYAWVAVRVDRFDARRYFRGGRDGRVPVASREVWRCARSASP